MNIENLTLKRGYADCDTRPLKSGISSKESIRAR